MVVICPTKDCVRLEQLLCFQKQGVIMGQAIEKTIDTAVELQIHTFDHDDSVMTFWL